MLDPLGVLALVGVAAEWLALGWLSGVGWPGGAAWGARWALRLLVGAFLIGLTQLLLALVGVGFASVPLVLLVAAVFAGALRLASEPGAAMPQVPFDTRERVGWVVLCVVLGAAAVRAFVVPEAGWDAFSHWGLKAQAFALQGSIVDARTTHEYYPPLVPLLEAWLYLHRGAVSIDAGKTVWPIIGAAFAVCLAWHLRLVLQARWLAPFVAAAIVLSSTQLLESFWTGQADLALTTYLSLATLAAFQYLRQPDRTWLVQVAIFGAAAALSKYEGLPRVGVVIAALAVEWLLSRRALAVSAALALLLGAAIGILPWLAFRAMRAILATSEHISEFQPQAIVAVLSAMAASLGGVRTGGALLVVTLGWLAAGRRLVEPPLRLLALVVVGQLAATLLAFLISETSPALQAQTSATRLLEQFMPIALFVAAVGLECALKPTPSEPAPIIGPRR
jgi:hypothetical protein